MTKILISCKKWQLEAVRLALDCNLYKTTALSYMNVGEDLYLLEVANKQECVLYAECLRYISGSDPVNGPEWIELAEMLEDAVAGICNDFTA